MWPSRKVIYPVWVVLFGLVACTCPIVPAITHDSSSVTTYGTVSDPDSGQPVEGATIQLWRYPYANRTGDQSTTTGEDGTFTFDPVDIDSETIITVTLIYNATVQQIQRSGTDTQQNPEFDFTVNIDSPPVAGDLGWYAFPGQVTDAVSGNPIPDAQVQYSHFSYNHDHSPQTVVTGPDGFFTLAPIFVHDTDSITFTVEKDGYLPAEIRFAGMDIYYRTLIELPLEPEAD